MRKRNLEDTAFKTAYTPTDNHPGIKFGKYTRTKESFKDECNINNIMKKYQKTGQLPQMIKQNPIWGDFSQPMDLQEALDVVIHAETQFNALDAQTRKKFDHDPAKFLEFANNPENADEMAKMGLIKPEARERVENAKKQQKEKEFNDAVSKEATKRMEKSRGTQKSDSKDD